MTPEEIAREFNPQLFAKTATGAWVWHAQSERDEALSAAARVLSLFPEGRSEQDQGGGDPALGAETFRIAVGWQERCGKAEAEAERLRADVFRPGVMRCAKCQFRLIRNVLYAQTGNIGAGTSETEPCPNGCGPLWPVTWKDECKEADRCWDQQVERAVKAEADLSAARLRIKALVEIAEGERVRWVKAAAKHAREDGRRSDHEQADFERARTAKRIVDKMCALLSSAQGETKEGFDGLPELPCGSRDEASLGATAALADRCGPYTCIKCAAGTWNDDDWCDVCRDGSAALAGEE